MVRVCYHQRKNVSNLMEWRRLTMIILLATAAITLVLSYTITNPISHFLQLPGSTPIQPLPTHALSASEFDSSPVTDAYLKKFLSPSEVAPFPISVTNHTVNEMGEKPKVTISFIFKFLLRCFSWSFFSCVFLHRFFKHHSILHSPTILKFLSRLKTSRP